MRGSYVLDLGANRGEFARAVTERFGVTCVAVEPTAQLAQGIAGDGVRVRQIAITGEPGEVVLYVSENPEASSLVVGQDDAIGTETVPGVPLAASIEQEQLEGVGLAKVDIEGGERDLFLNADADTLRRVAQFSVEFHVFTGALSEDDVVQIRRRLEDGF